MDIVAHNRSAWNNYAEKEDQWTVPVTEKEIEDARAGKWNVVLTPRKPVPQHWFPNLRGLKVLGLASGGGQQCPIFAALGADVTVFDNADRQLQQDKTLSDKYNLGIKTVQGSMKDLSVFADQTFDLIFNPCSVVFVDDVIPVWNECYRVLKPNGILMTGLMNPIAFQLDSETLKLTHKQPYSDIRDFPADKLATFIKDNEALEFGHTLTDQIGGQLAAGFNLTHMYEDYWGDGHQLDNYFPVYMATRAVKSAK